MPQLSAESAGSMRKNFKQMYLVIPLFKHDRTILVSYFFNLTASRLGSLVHVDRVALPALLDNPRFTGGCFLCKHCKHMYLVIPLFKHDQITFAHTSSILQLLGWVPLCVDVGRVALPGRLDNPRFPGGCFHRFTLPWS